jgi:amino acid adenylation domain-containing protein
MASKGAAMNANESIAIVGMAGRFPGAASVDELWQNLIDGRDSITRFTPEQLSPLVPRELRNHPGYVPARGGVADVDRFDAAFFGIPPREALLIDPQQRIFLELCWNALEHAGVDPKRAEGSIGVYAGGSDNGYRRLLDACPEAQASGEFALMVADEKDYIATRVAHRLDLRGPALSIHTACSTSLVAVTQAWYALMSWQCDIALAGGISILVPQEAGYLAVDGAIDSADGCCRPFDAQANGTVFSSGGGVVVLKRYADALVAGDTVYALIRGVGINNDGGDKASFSAPSVRGQSAAIGMALANADVDCDSIGYVEAHGSGTPLGDPIEVEALARAFADDCRIDRPCWLGSIKGNIGHLIAAAGVAGLIKTTLALHRERIPPTLHFRKANPQINFGPTPFRVADHVIDWPRGAVPRRAGVSSFGIGGTNAHVILEEAPLPDAWIATTGCAVPLMLSARDPASLQRRIDDLVGALDKYTDDDLADIGWTLASGRQPMPCRAVAVASSIVEAQQALRLLNPASPAVSSVSAGSADVRGRDVLFASAIAWCAGGDVDWERSFTMPRRRVPLPTYPFRGKRHWPRLPAQQAVESLGANETPLAEQSLQSASPGVHPGEPSESQTQMNRCVEQAVSVQSIESELRELLACVCGTDAIDSNSADSFLDLGLDSLAVVEFALELEQRYACKLPFRRLMEDLDSIDKLVAHVTAVKSHPSGTADSGMPATHVTSAPPTQKTRADLPVRLPLTDAQQEKWLGSQDGAEAGVIYNEAVTLSFAGKLDVTLLAQSIERIAARHEMFSIKVDPNGREQIYVPPSSLHLMQRHFCAHVDPDAAVDEFVLEQAALPFDLGAAPLLRATLLRSAEDKHVLHLIGHHLLFDGWSMRVLVAEIVENYIALRAGREPALPAAHSWREYAVAECAQRDGAAGQADLAWWRERYRELPDPIALPSDGGDQALDSATSTTVHAELGAGLSARIVAAARHASVTPFAFMLTAYLVLLHRLSGQADLNCGIPVARQAAHGIDRMIGDGDNTLPLRIAIDSRETVSALLHRVQHELLDAMEHPRVSVGMLGRELDLLRRAGRALLIDAVFNLVPPIPVPQIEGLDCRVGSCPKVATDMELACHVVVAKQGYAIELHYNRTRYSRISVEGWIACLARVLEQMTDDAASTVADIDLLGAAQRETILHGWNATARDYDFSLSVADLIATQARSRPDAIALQSEESTLTYAAFEHRIVAAAHGLAARGIGRDDLIGISMPRGVAMLVAVLAVLRAGAAYVPLDPTFPVERLRYMAEHARIRHVLVDARQGVPVAIASVCEALDLAEVEKTSTGLAELPQVRAEDLAYVLYTSGSTGQPKGVRITHRNLLNFLHAMRERPGMEADDILCAVTTLSFDIAGLELFLPLIVGARVVIASDAQVHDVHALTRLIRDARVNVMQITPSLLRALIGEAGAAAVRGLKLLVGGEALPRDLADTVLTECAQLWNMFGPTETTIWSCCHRVTTGEADIPLGQPIANTRVYVLDTNRQPQLPGVIGEIFIAGAGVADGYLHAPDMSAERFLPDPFAGDGSRMYRTGDLGSLREGVLYFHGRNDQQIKVRGYRIEPGEIETAACFDADVIEAAAVARVFGANDTRIVLHVASPSSAADLAPRLRSHLRAKLPAYMLPQHVEVSASLPKTPNGKIDRKALAQSAVGMPPEIPAADANQTYLADLWRELLGSVEQLGGDDNFFDLGGHSLLAMEMAARVKRERGVRLPLLKIAGNSLAVLAAELPLLPDDANAAEPAIPGRRHDRGQRA